MRRSIVVTWPKSKPLGEFGPTGVGYLPELWRANDVGDVINFRVARLPRWLDSIEDHGWTGWPYGVRGPRCYMVHDGAVRGWVQVIGTCHRAEGEVHGWPAGFYIVRDAMWQPIDPIPMRGFQGWRWFDQEVTS